MHSSHLTVFRLLAGCLLGASGLTAVATTPIPRPGRGPVGPAPIIAASHRASSSVVPVRREPRPAEVTLLDEVGRLARPVARGQAAAWTAELRAGRPNPRRAAWLHLRIGECELARDEQPEAAIGHFRAARHLLPGASPSAGLAAYDSAVALFYAGAYGEAAAAFHRLQSPGAARAGCDPRRCALWYRHALACAGYHAQRARLGIPEPTRLDPLCGPAGLAVCLRGLSLPYERERVARACRHTGEGSNAQDLVNACARLGVVGRVLTADERGLRALPKPLVAYVEHDHFVALVRADARGVSYVCSDCGGWPGGRVDLTWKQWRALDPTVYVTVSRRGSPADRLLAAALAGPARGAPLLRLAAAGPLSRLHVWGQRRSSTPAPPLSAHVMTYVTPGAAVCGSKPKGLHCPPWIACPMDGGCGGGAGPSAGEPVNLATGEEEYQPSPDLVVYNPRGPSIVWRRIYNSLRGPDPAYESDDFGIGWSHPYNILINDPNADTYPQAPIGEPPSSMATTGADAPAPGLTWDIVQNGSTVATSSSPGGWSVGFTPSPSSLQVGAPASASSSRGYEARYYSSSLGIDASCPFDTCPPNSIPQGAAEPCPVTGSDAPGARLQWDVLLNGATVATSSFPKGWQVQVGAAGTPIPVTPALLATVAANYEVRVNAGGTMNSATFSVLQDRFNYSSKPKTLILANGARVNIMPNGVPTAGQTVVSCRVDPGSPLFVHWIYDGSDGGHYVIGFPDQSQWVMGNPVTAQSANGVNYQLNQILDRGGNALTFRYNNPPGRAGFPMLSQILDSKNNALLTLSPTPDQTANVQSVTDAYQRTIYYQYGTYSNPNVDFTTAPLYTSYQEVNWASQVVASTVPLSSAPMRWQYGYGTTRANGEVGPDGPEQVRYMDSITVPSPHPTMQAPTSTASISYDASGYVMSVQDANLNVRTYNQGNDPQNLNQTTVAITNPTKNSGFTFSYTVSWNSFMQQTNTIVTGTTTQTDGTANVPVTSTFADPNDPYRPDTVTVGAKVSRFQWDAYGNLTQTTSPRGVVTKYIWHYDQYALGRLMEMDEGANYPTSGMGTLAKAPVTFAYCPNGLLQAVTTPAPGYTGAGSPTVQTSYAYDYLGNVLAVFTPTNLPAGGSFVTHLSYIQDGSYNQAAAIGQPLMIKDPAGNVTHYRYDPRANLTQVTDASGNEADAVYNLADQPTTITYPKAMPSSTGRTSTVYSPLYPGGPITTVTELNESGARVQQVAATYGVEGELAARTGDTEAVSLVYDPAYRLAALADGKNNTTSFKYGPNGTNAGYLSQVVYPATDNVTLGLYTAAGLPAQRTDGNGAITSYVYGDQAPYTDAAGRLTAIQYQGSTTSLTYDGYGRVSTMVDSSGTTTYTYDDVNEVISVQTVFSGLPAGHNTFTISYTYWPNGSRKTMTTPAGTVSYNYDSDGRMASMVNSPTGQTSETTQWSYYSNNWLLTQTLPNQAASTYTYNGRGFLTDLSTKNGSGGLLSDFSTAPDALDNPASLTATIPGTTPNYGGGTTYSADNAEQLKGENSTRGGGSGYSNSFMYDLAGNPTTFRNSGPIGYNPDNQNTAFNYDNNGSPEFYTGGSAMRYDGENRLIQVGDIVNCCGSDRASGPLS